MAMQLVCEGRCNGGAVSNYDGIVRRSRDQGRGLLPAEIELGRTLRHTPHARLGDEMFECVRCSHVRRCGGNPSWKANRVAS